MSTCILSYTSESEPLLQRRRGAARGRCRAKGASDMPHMLQGFTCSAGPERETSLVPFKQECSQRVSGRAVTLDLLQVRVGLPSVRPPALPP